MSRLLRVMHQEQQNKFLLCENLHEDEPDSDSGPGTVFYFHIPLPPALCVKSENHDGQPSGWALPHGLATHVCGLGLYLV